MPERCRDPAGHRCGTAARIPFFGEATALGISRQNRATEPTHIHAGVAGPRKINKSLRSPIRARWIWPDGLLRHAPPSSDDTRHAPHRRHQRRWPDRHRKTLHRLLTARQPLPEGPLLATVTWAVSSRQRPLRPRRATTCRAYPKSRHQQRQPSFVSSNCSYAGLDPKGRFRSRNKSSSSPDRHLKFSHQQNTSSDENHAHSDTHATQIVVNWELLAHIFPNVCAIVRSG